MRRSKKDRRGSDTNQKTEIEDQNNGNEMPDVVHEVPEGLESTATKNDRKIHLSNNNQKPQFN